MVTTNDDDDARMVECAVAPTDVDFGTQSMSLYLPTTIRTLPPICLRHDTSSQLASCCRRSRSRPCQSFTSTGTGSMTQTHTRTTTTDSHRFVSGRLVQADTKNTLPIYRSLVASRGLFSLLSLWSTYGSARVF